MFSLWLSLGLLAFLGLAILALAIKQAPKLSEELNQQANARQLENIQLYKNKLAELEASYQAGKLEEAVYQELVTEAEDLLLDDAAVEEQREWRSVNNKAALASLVGIGLLVAGLSFFTYNQLGAKPQLEAKLAQDALIAEGREDFGALLTRFEQAVESNPNDVQGWSLLAQIYFDTQQLEKAAKAISHINRLEGPNATLYAQEAQALYFAGQGQVSPKVTELLEKAFTLDAKDPLALSLQGTIAYHQQDWEGARQAWEAALPFASRINADDQLLDGVADVRERLGMPPLTSGGPSFVVNLSLSNAAQLLVHPEATIFVFASLPEGGAPLAATRLKAKDLPSRITLSNQNAMQPSHNLSSATEVIISARLSNSGSTQPQEGDWQGSSQLLNVDGRQTLNLEINQQL